MRQLNRIERFIPQACSTSEFCLCLHRVNCAAKIATFNSPLIRRPPHINLLLRNCSFEVLILIVSIFHDHLVARFLKRALPTQNKRNHRSFSEFSARSASFLIGILTWRCMRPISKSPNHRPTEAVEGADLARCDSPHAFHNCACIQNYASL